MSSFRESFSREPKPFIICDSGCKWNVDDNSSFEAKESVFFK